MRNYYVEKGMAFAEDQFMQIQDLEPTPSPTVPAMPSTTTRHKKRCAQTSPQATPSLSESSITTTLPEPSATPTRQELSLFQQWAQALLRGDTDEALRLFNSNPEEIYSGLRSERTSEKKQESGTIFWNCWVR